MAAPPVTRESLAAVPFQRLAEILGSKSRALATRRWLFSAETPQTLPERIPGVAPQPWAALRQEMDLPQWSIGARLAADDGTVKFTVRFPGAAVETVLIPARGRSTVCLSSQSGCTRSCRFCATATLDFDRSLTAGEIVMQYALARAEAPPEAPARNIVFMGMGEPMDNLDAVMTAIDRLCEEGEPRLAAEHITVSTSGVVPGMRRFLKESQRGHLALSLNATNDALRTRLMPHNRTWPIAQLLEVLRDDYRGLSGRRYFIEYILFDGINDSDADAAGLVALLRGLPTHVNLIPFNTFAELPFAPSPRERVLAFRRIVHDGGLRCLIRRPRGRDVAAACGQLARTAG